MGELRAGRQASGGQGGRQPGHHGKAGEHPSMLGGRHTGTLASQTNRNLSTRRLAPAEAVSPVSGWHQDDLSGSGSRRDLSSPGAADRLLLDSPVIAAECPLIGKYAQEVDTYS